MAVRKKPRKTVEPNEAQLRSKLDRYETFFGEIETFIGNIRTSKTALQEAVAKEAEAKAALDAAKNERRELEQLIDGTKDALYRLIEPGAGIDVMPLFDRMEPADPEKHGTNSERWRKEPISVLRLSPVATQSLLAAEIVCVGQLQDAVLAKPDKWWEPIEGITDAIAAAVTDKLNDFIYRDGE